MSCLKCQLINRLEWLWIFKEKYHQGAMRIKHLKSKKWKIFNKKTWIWESKLHFSLINNVNNDALETGTYEKLGKLMDNYNPDVTVEEHFNEEQLQEIQEFINELLNTDEIKSTFNFLHSHKLVSDIQDFRDKIEKLWFELYDRDGISSTKTLGSRYVIFL